MNTTTETWVDIPGYENVYKVNNLGDILSVRSNRSMRPQLAGAGYCCIMLSFNGTRSQRYIHRIVLESFGIPKDGKTDVNHRNGIKTDNRLENLEWCTKSENTKHAFRTGLMSKAGEKGSRAKITREQAIEIFYSDLPTKVLAEKYNMLPNNIRHIKTKSIWKCLWKTDQERAS